MYTQDELLKRRAKLSDTQLALLQKRLQQKALPERATHTIQRQPPGQANPLSFAQEGFWFLQHLDPDGTAYNELIALSLRGTLDHEALALAFEALLQRHELLRSTFPLIEREVRQLVHAANELATAIPLIDLRVVPPTERAQEARRLSNEALQRPFQLLQEVPWRICLLRLQEDEHILLVTMHHIVTDAWSLELFARDLMVLYRCAGEGQPSTLPELPIQYADFACWQRQWAEGPAFHKQVAYWQQQLKGPLPIMNLPTDHPRPAQHSYRGQRVQWSIPSALYQKLRQLCRQEDITLFMLLLTALNILFYRYTHQEDIIIGTPVAGRLLPELEPVLGSFVNTLLLRTSLTGAMSVRELLQRVRTMALDAYDHQDVPFEKLLATLKPGQHTDPNALFQVMFVLQNVPQTVNSLSALTVEPAEVDFTTTRRDISLVLQESAYGLHGYAEFSTDLFEASTIERMLAHYSHLLACILDDPEACIAELPLLSPGEQQEMLVGWNTPAASSVQDRDTEYSEAAGSIDCTHSIHQMFEAQVARTPEATALVWEGQRLSYQVLDEYANQLARYLQRLGVKPGATVGLCLERSFEMLIGICAILKAGAAYVPLDPAYPQERLAFLLQDAQVAILLTMQATFSLLPKHAAHVICLDSEWERIAQESTDAVQSAVELDNLAYIIYTSGSTGQPKGVMVSHRNLLHSTRTRMGYYRARVKRFLLLPSFAFDSSVAIIFWTLCQGGTLVLPRADRYPGIAALAELIEQEDVTHILCTPSLYKPLLEPPYCQQLYTLETVVVAGEVCPKELVERHFERLPQTQLFNEYGPTEGTVWSTVHACQPHSTRAIVPIGRPITGTQVYVLDAWLQPSPIGVTGELYIGGPGISHGYLNQPTLTAQLFVPDPFCHYAGARLYKTGDKVRYLPTGEIEFLGRADSQVSLRGYRIELEEITVTLEKHAAIREATVIIQTQLESSFLVAYIVLWPERSATARELRGYLAQQLPSYMLPSSFVLLDHLPLNVNGKVDRRQLPVVEPGNSSNASSFVAARDTIEEMLSGIWSQLLEVEQIDVYDDWFGLGGHSLLATQVAARIRTTFGIDLPLRKFLEFTTIAEQAQALKEAMRTRQGLETPPFVIVSRQQDIPLSFTQRRQWFLHQLELDSHLYTIFGGVRLLGTLRVDMLVQSLQEVVRRHEILRTNFVLKGEHLVQVITPDRTLPLELVDLRALSSDGQDAEIMLLAAREQRYAFDLAQGPLLRAMLLVVSAEEHILLLTGHHICFDGWSVNVLLRELATFYSAFSTGTPIALPRLSAQYADFACWQHTLLQGERLEKLLTYWQRQLAQLPALQLPTDFPHPAERTYHAAAISLRLSSERTTALKNVGRREGVTLFMILLATFKVVLARYSGQYDVVVGSPIAGRNSTEVENLIGCFINTLVLRTDISGNPTFAEVLARVRSVSLDAYTHQDLPFEQLLETLNPERDLRRNPLFQVFFAFQNIPDYHVELPDLHATFLDQESERTLFDLDLTLREEQGEIVGNFTYNTALFEAGTIGRLHEYFLTVLTALSTDAAQHIDDIPLLSEEEKRQLLTTWNATGVAYPHEARFHEYVALQARVLPDAIAVSDDAEQVSYCELDARATRLSAYLAAHGVKPEQVVGLYTERNVAWAVAVLAIFKAGGVYLPMDPRHPEARQRYILEHCACHLILTTQELEDKVASLLPTDTIPMLCLDALLHEAPVADWQPISYPATQLAYIIYTSGSTGQPKGVMVEHRGMLNHLHAKLAALELTTSDVIAQTASQCFDISIWQLLAAWLVGGQVRIYSDEVAMNPELLVQRLEQDGVSIVEVVPAVLRGMITVQELRGAQKMRLERLRWLIPTGEALATELCARWLQLYPSIPLLNAYGPTECSDDVTHHVVSELVGRSEVGQVVPIGRPIGNLRVYVLDRQQQLQPIGVSGEIYIGGVGVGRGYTGDATKTAERFLPDAWGETSGERVYRTGDVGRYRVDGTIEFQGRVDRQVKIRGYRIEMEEVEQALGRQVGVKEALVDARQGPSGQLWLVGYVVPREGYQLVIEELREAVGQLLPGYMVPAVIVQLRTLPLMPNGKHDYCALPDPVAQDATLEKTYMPARTPLEEQLVAIWTSVLKLPRIGIYENFFTIGGHSLLTVPLLASIQEAWPITLPLRSIFEFPTIDQLSGEIERLLVSTPNAIQEEPNEAHGGWHTDAVLAPDIMPPADYHISEPGSEIGPEFIFLTNGTGFLGAFLLADLLQNTSASIYCLVRCQDENEGMRRIHAVLKASYLWQPAFAGRIFPVVGDLAQPRLGIAPDVYEYLTTTIDTIYHTGAAVSQVLSYEELRPINVYGTQEVLRLASIEKVKQMHHISTLGVLSVGHSAEEQIMFEQESLDEHHDYMLTGYNQSKWVAEKIVMQARERGLPVSIYRPGRLTGHSQTGAWQTHDLLCRQIKGCIQLGSIPSAVLDELLSITPVDYASQAIVALSLQKASLGGVFHLCNPRSIMVDDLVDWINSFGYTLKKVPYTLWRAQLRQAVEMALDNALAPFLAIYPEQIEGEDDQVASAQVVFDDRYTRAGLVGTRITCPPADAVLFHTYLSYFVRCGFLAAPPSSHMLDSLPVK